MKNIRPFLKTASYGMLLLFVNQMVFPIYSYAITGSSTMPEYSSFEPVSTSNMVNEFDGSFTYNLPLLNVPNGYPVNLAYHSSSVNNEAMASWVGLGWNINPGVINRNKKGFPDEYDGAKVTYFNKMPANWTISATAGLTVDLFAKEKGGRKKKNSALGANISQTTSFNNYNGLGTAVNYGVTAFAGIVNLNGGFANGKYSGGSYSINPMNALNYFNNSREDLKRNIGESDKDLLERQNNSDKDADSKDAAKVSKAKSYFNPSLGPSFRPIPTSVSESFGVMTSLKFDAGITLLPVSIKPQGNIKGAFSMQWNRRTTRERTVYGYLNSDKAYANPEHMMDFSMEMESHFEKNDEILGYPMANADNYSLSGEAFGGAFEATRSDFGYFRPGFVRSEDIGVDVGVSGTLPLNFIPVVVNSEVGIGGSAASNYHRTDITGWEDFMSSTHQFKSDSQFPQSEEKDFYLFSGDRAGYFDLTEKGTGFDDMPFTPNLSGNLVEGKTNGSDSHFQGSRKFDFRSQGKKKKRSTHIVTHTNADFAEMGRLGVPYLTYEKDLKIFVGGADVPYNHGDYPSNAIAEIVATNKDGLIYVYGLPVYERNEKSIQYGLKFGDYSTSQATFSEDGMVATLTGSFSELGSSRKMGQSDGNMYPTTYLLTQILTPDYVDRTGDGLSDDDFGSFTQLKYERVHGGGTSANGWYGHKSPYYGVNLSTGSLSSNKDDMGSFSYGEKEVYLLEEIISKTHKAKFKKSDRDDGKSVGIANGSTEEAIAKWSGSSNRKGLKKLDNIILTHFKTGEEISRVNFEYEPSGSSLSPGLPNASNSAGKLTLKKVWVEHGGVSKNRIQPYEFTYSYPSSYSTTTNNFSGLNAHFTTYSGSQNPNYKAVNTDPWGQYCNYAGDQDNINSKDANNDFYSVSANKKDNLKRFFPYVNQNPNYSVFDPAAYLLKQIKLPSGGEIHVQYEQHDYAYVQDKNAMVMVPLNDWTQGLEKNNKKYYVNLSKIGISTSGLSTTQQKDLGEKLFKPMLDGNRMYFKFLYAILGKDPDYRYTHSDYMEGFASISSYGYDTSRGFFFCFDDQPSSGGSVAWVQNISNPGKTSKREIPRKICKDFYKSQRRLLIDGGTNADGLTSSVNSGDEKGMGKAFLSILSSGGGIFKGTVEKCREMDPDMSFVRLNLPLGENGKPGKLAGGARVKRLMMYESGTMLGDPESIYGTEYIYRVNDDGTGISSGVATNESGNMKMENPWVNPIDKSDISLGEAILGSTYLYKHMGPIGFGFMPSQSIGYSKIISKSLHSGKTGTGVTIKEFYTAKDHPCFMTNASSDAPSPKYGRKPQLTSNIGVPGFSVTNEKFSATQGIVVHLNDMHGKPYRTRAIANDGQTVVSSTTHKYMHYTKRSDDQTKTVKVMGDQMELKDVRLGEMGRKVSQYGYSKTIEDENSSIRASIDADGPGGLLLLFTVVPIPGFLKKFKDFNIPISASISNIKYNTASVSKVLEHASIATEVITMNDGITTETVNRVFDDHTGDPVITSFKDDFKEGMYLEQNFRASWNYTGMKSKYQNEGLVITPALMGVPSISGNTVGGNTYITFSAGTAPCNLTDRFQSGDLIQLNNTSLLFHVDKVDPLNNQLVVQRSMHGTAGLSNTNITKIEILRSGFTNQLNTNTGQTVYFSSTGLPSFYSTGSGGIALTSNDFVDNLNDALIGVSATKQITLTNMYQDLDLSNFAILPCEEAMVTNMVIDVIVNTNVNPIEMTFSIASFDYSCDGGDTFNSYSCGEGQQNPKQ